MCNFFLIFSECFQNIFANCNPLFLICLYNIYCIFYISVTSTETSLVRDLVVHIVSSDINKPVLCGRIKSISRGSKRSRYALKLVAKSLSLAAVGPRQRVLFPSRALFARACCMYNRAEPVLRSARTSAALYT